jgi:hypothetical protein
LKPGNGGIGAGAVDALHSRGWRSMGPQGFCETQRWGTYPLYRLCREVKSTEGIVKDAGGLGYEDLDGGKAPLPALPHGIQGIRIASARESGAIVHAEYVPEDGE